jgi:hypothetical protein
MRGVKAKRLRKEARELKEYWPNLPIWHKYTVRDVYKRMKRT